MSGGLGGGRAIRLHMVGSLKKLVDKWKSWRQVHNIHIFLFVQCVQASLIEGHTW